MELASSGSRPMASTPPGPGHIGQALWTMAEARASLPATICDGRLRSGPEFLERVAALASGLRSLGLQCGHRVAIAALNSDWYLEWLLAVPCAGGIIAPLNYRWSSREALNAIRQVDPSFLVIDQHCLSVAMEVQKHLPHITLVTLGGLSMEGAQEAESIVKLLGGEQGFEMFWAPDDIALICFTSGTTGMPKGAAISHTALMVQSLAKIRMVNYSSSDVYLHTSPLCHIGGISSAHAMILAGGCHVFQPKFIALDAIAAIRQYQITAMITVPTMLIDLSSLILSRGESECSLKTILNGAGSLPVVALEKAVKAFPAAHILSAYGMTEACSSMSFLTLHDPHLDEGTQCSSITTSSSVSKKQKDRKPLISLGGYCVGMPAPHVDMVIGRGTSVSFGVCGLFKAGNVLVRGPHMMKKYWVSSEPAFEDSGWFDTGDVGWMDEQGRLWLLGRKKDVIKSGGENVYCYEVEDVLSRHPGVSIAAVVGVPDVRFGEMVGAMIMLRNGWVWEENIINSSSRGGSIEHATALGGGQPTGVLSPSLLHLYCRQQGLSSFKIPKLWLWKRELSHLTSSGKVRKDAVREELTAFYKSRQSIHGSMTSKL